jgi:hypothetical protein
VKQQAAPEPVRAIEGFKGAETDQTYQECLRIANKAKGDVARAEAMVQLIEETIDQEEKVMQQHKNQKEALVLLLNN